MEAASSVGRAGWITVTVKPWVALMTGAPLSETTTWTACVAGDCAMVGRQVSAPLFVSMETPAGALSKR